MVLRTIPVSLTSEIADSSTSSTETAEPVLIKNESEMETAEAIPEDGRRTRVQFDMSRNTKYENELYCKEDLKLWGLWYSRVEILALKTAVSSMARLLISQNGREVGRGNYIGIMENLYTKCNTMTTPSSLEKGDLLFSPFEVQQLLKRDEEELLLYIGMDQWVLRGMAYSRRVKKMLLGDVVCDKWTTTPEQMRSDCEVITLPSRSYARIAAEVQLLAQDDWLF